MCEPGPRHQIRFFPSRLSLLPEQLQFAAPDNTSHIVKYYRAVHIVTRKHLSEAMQEYPDAANEIKAWVVIVEGVRWHNFAEVPRMFRDADYIDGYVVFNIRRNRFRLITVIRYAKTTDAKRREGHVYIRSFLTHKEYNDRRKWDRRFGAK
jgi:mRNA interferase HigB